MTKLDYANEVCGYLTEYGYNTTITENYRNNGSYVAISVRKGDEKIAPVFSIGDAEDREPKDFADYICSFLPAEINTDVITNIMTDREQVLDRVYYILVNSDLNACRDTLVKRKINKTLELQYKIDISDIMENARITLEHKHIENLGIGENELYIRAYANTIDKFPYSLEKMIDILPVEIPDLNFWVLSNKSKVYGAGTILYSGMKEVLDIAVGGDYICIPSSVHEWIIAPSVFGDKEILTTIIRDVNNNVVLGEEVLSDRPYELITDGVLFEV